MAAKTSRFSPFFLFVVDPFRLWRNLLFRTEQKLSELLTDIMGNDRFAKATGTQFEAMLHVHRIFSENMALLLASLNMPSRSDVVALSERLGRIEDRISEIEVTLEKVQDSRARPGDRSEEDGPRPVRRTRRPPEETVEGRDPAS